MKQNFCVKYSGKSRKEIKQEFISEINILLHRYYGVNSDKKICKRVNQELATILKTNLFLDIAVLQEVCDWIHKSGYSYWLSGTTSSSFILYLLGIANINPLPAHSICPKCHSIIWHNNIKDGFDLPTDVCSCIKDNDTMEVDGHDISWENLLMFDDKTPNLQIRIPYLLKDQLLEHLEQNWLISLDNKVSLTFPYKNKIGRASCRERV